MPHRQVFVCYRRGDSQYVAYRIYEELKSQFSVFIDQENTPAGVDYRTHLIRAVIDCDVLLCVIGPHWLESENLDGTRRLDESGDFVRIELQTAFERDKCIVPVLLTGADMPSVDDLPVSLKDLAYRHAVRVGHRTVELDGGIRKLTEIVHDQLTRKRKSWNDSSRQEEHESEQTFSQRLANAVREKGTPVMVGLDPRIERLPRSFLGVGGLSVQDGAEACRRFCEEVIDVVSPLVPAVKANAAFFELLGPDGMAALAQVVSYARNRGLLVVLDGKRGDVGSTAYAYAKAYLGVPPASVWGADSLTVNPYLGTDSLEPFIQAAGATKCGIFVLVRTSNPGSQLIQEFSRDGQAVYELLADHVAELNEHTVDSTGYGSVGAIVGATWPGQLSALRERMPQSWLLVPGYGAQGGTSQDIAAAFDSHGLGAIINSSRAIIFAHASARYEAIPSGSWQLAVENATRDMIADLRQITAVSKLSAT